MILKSNSLAFLYCWSGSTGQSNCWSSNMSMYLFNSFAVNRWRNRSWSNLSNRSTFLVHSFSLNWTTRPS